MTIRDGLIPLVNLLPGAHATKAARGAISRIIGWLFTKEVLEESAVNIGGITAKQAGTLRALLLKIPGVEDVGAFGSRTVGNFSKESDLDIAIFGQINKSDPATIGAVRQAQEYAESIGIGLGKEGRAPFCRTYSSGVSLRNF